MMYLHNNKEQFFNVLESVSKVSKIQADLVEKDYYVSLILKEIATSSNKVVFKGGTSLSKALKAINRFSEDIDISFSEHIGASRRKKLKYNIIAPIAEKLGLVITNLDKTQSDRDINNYIFEYKPLCNSNAHIIPAVKVETSLITAVFPFQAMPIGNYIADYAKDISLKDYGLEPFMMNVQVLERTLIDKVFAICDYYLAEKSRRLSRHIYDIHKILPRINFNEQFRKLLQKVREIRSSLDICPSAKPGININQLLKEICDKDFFKSDYEGVTQFFIFDNIKYKETKESLKKIIDSNVFA
ncbi:nucleotidyl transferase AbiEii/AbiGii toxin family protein [Fibrobacter sp.]|uniref:nucleotidyl transferase AbiEii/AbiGii toxin family protein n=1 Tax=Fibrobacter sp. TaxID=35828 RepID=UPI0025C364B9|nr:nucleotidyl transferase AbiEii/AbiGii toxin family protein [Fibrobacter sp.]MBR3073590.1 nucleotidyl transferase AbiEii/AbiGii toxin family protein [Fibrobacter sp.]